MNIVITTGDPLGVGPQISVNAIKRLPYSRRKNIVLIGSEEFLKKAGWDYNLTPLIPVEFFDKDIQKRAAFISFKSLNVATKLISKGLVSAIVTAPISKNLWLKYGINYNGHTDYFRKIFKRELLMCFVRKNIIAGLMTEHIPTKDVSKHIKKEKIVKKIKLLIDLTKRFKIKKPKLAISCLNPHCGENGRIGVEEIKEIIPAVKIIKKMGIDLIGPLNPDDCIKNNIENIVNASLFMYHDQLIPLIKAIDLTKNDIVHITWGLDFIRTSPTHGTAKDIAWKGKVDYLSMLCAINTAFNLRTEYQ